MMEKFQLRAVRAKPCYEEKLKESKGIAEHRAPKENPLRLSFPSFHSNGGERVKIKEQKEKEQRATWCFASSTFQHGVAQSSLHSLAPSLSESALLLSLSLSLSCSWKSFLVAQK